MKGGLHEHAALQCDGVGANAAAPAGLAPAIVHARAVWRLTRALVHVAAGLVTVQMLFPWLGSRTRHRLIARWSRRMFQALGVHIEQKGWLHADARMLVANHVSWLDIMAVHAFCGQARFVAMAELRQWTGVARLVEAAGTIYLHRKRKRDLLRVVREVAEALRAGALVGVFPEGLVSDGRGLPRFHGNLLQSAIDAGVAVQPVALRYADAAGPVSDAVLFTGDITLPQSLWRIACAQGLVLHLRVLPARSTFGEKRRGLAARLHRDVAAALSVRL